MILLPLLLAAHAAAAETARSLGCPDRFSIDRTMAAAARSRLPAETEKARAALLSSAEDYYRCEAYAHDDESWCAPLERLGRRKSCGDAYKAMVGNKKALMDQPDAAAPAPGASADAAAFAAAYKAKDAALCGDSLVCRLFFGGGDQVCRSYYAKARSYVCGDVPAGSAVIPLDPGAAAAKTASDLAQARGLADSAEAEIARLEKTGKPAPSPDARRRCEDGLTVPGVVRYLDEHPVPAELAQWLNEIKHTASAYYTCAAFARRQPEMCAPHKEFDEIYPPKTFQGDSIVWRWGTICRAHYNEMTLVHALMTKDARFTALCPPTLAQTAEWEDKEFKDEDLPKVCGIVKDYSSRPAAACARLKPLFLEADQARKCEAVMGRLNGEASACEAFHTPLVRKRCLEYAAFKTARAAKDPDRCGEAPLCRVFMGAGDEPCAAYADSLRGPVCGAYPAAGEPALDFAARRLEAQAWLDKAMALKAAGADEAAWKALAERVAALRARLAAAASRLEG
jgi:hypothetical protein